MKLSVPDVLLLVREYYSKPGNGAGGSLHIALDEGNVKDGHINSCIEYALERGDAEGAVLGEILLDMSKTQRMKLCNAKKG